jgi:DNA-binding transcriptional ArsR family regulator
MNMEDLKVLEELFDQKVIGVLKALFREPRELYLQEVSEKAKVSMATTSRILSRLERLDILEVRNVSRIKLYKIKANEKTQSLSKLFKEEVQILKEFSQRASRIPGIKTIMLHGKEQANRADVLLIGENIDPGLVKALCTQIREEFKFMVTTLALTPEQYGQISQMGLYSGTKKILYEVAK